MIGVPLVTRMKSFTTFGLVLLSSVTVLIEMERHIETSSAKKVMMLLTTAMTAGISDLYRLLCKHRSTGTEFAVSVVKNLSLT